MKALIVGMGFGNLYKSIYDNRGDTVVTVDADPSRGQYQIIEDAVKDHQEFDVAHICVPNYLHEGMARRAAPFSKIVFVEKPGFETLRQWRAIVRDFPDTRFMMTKNNMWRDNIQEMKSLADRALNVEIKWINDDRIPNPGTWFTTKSKAFGGVTRDLMPHLLSLYAALSANYLAEGTELYAADQHHTLDGVTNTEYGVIDRNGTYDVDDYAHYRKSNGIQWDLIADWRSGSGDDRSITINTPTSSHRFELGLCPEYAYENMINDAVKNLDNDLWWKVQYKLDIWIQERIGQF